MKTKQIQDIHNALRGLKQLISNLESQVKNNTNLKVSDEYFAGILKKQFEPFVNQYVAKWDNKVSKLKDGEDGKPGLPGKDAEITKEILDGIAKDVLAQIAKPENGKDAKVTESLVQDIVDRVISYIPDLEVPEVNTDVIEANITATLTETLQELVGDTPDYEARFKELSERITLANLNNKVGGGLSNTAVQKLIDDAISEITSGGISDGDKGDITVTNSGDTWTIDDGVVTEAKLSTSVNASLDLADTALQDASTLQEVTDNGNTTTTGMNIGGDVDIATGKFFADSTTGNFGIGTDTPTNRLTTVVDVDNDGWKLFRTGWGNTSGIFFGNSLGVQGMEILGPASRSVSVSIAGNGDSDGFRVYRRDSGSNLFAFGVFNNGNVGFGTLSPDESIHTTGNIKAEGSVYFDQEIDNGNSGTADTIDWTAGNYQKSTLTGNCTFTFSAPSGVGSFNLKLVQDATGGRTITLPASVRTPGGSGITLSTGANAVDRLVCVYDGTNYDCQLAADFS